MTEKELFTPVGIRSPEPVAVKKRKTLPKGFPLLSVVVLSLLVLGCLFAEVLMTKDPTYLDLAHCNVAPNGEFLFGTDNLGRDVFSCIWYGGRISLAIGFLATVLSTGIAIVYGAASGMAPAWLDAILMRLTEIFLSVPTLLLVLFIQAIFGKPSVFSIGLIIGMTGWCSIAKIVRAEVRQLRASEYVLASQCMGGRFLHVLKRHLAPNFLSSIVFMVVMNLRAAIGFESTLSFMGMGLPLEIVSWGSMLSLADDALTTGAWWLILIPGGFLVALLMCVTNIGNYLRKCANRRESRL